MGYSGKSSIAQPAFYKIEVDGVMNEGWINQMCGMASKTQKTVDGFNETVLTGELIDQAALLGVLNALYNHGYVLRSVERQIHYQV